ncbi:ATP-binding protein [Candidatus Pyrohabitans sp.]
MIREFLNREHEMMLLQEEWEKEGGRLIILYGRRRVGKTRLLMEFTKDKEGIFYIAEDSSAQIQITGLRDKISDFFKDSLLRSLKITDWNQLFEYFSRNMPKERFYFVIDEFSYLIKSDRRIISLLQKFWDTSFSDSSVFMVLSGSMLGLMSEAVLSHASPLYGRRTRDILLEELSFKHSRKFVRMPFEDALKLYLAIGGVPEYLLKASEYNSLNRFLSREFFNKMGYFYREPYFIISQEFKELKIYFSVLNAIAYGRTSPKEIANFVGIDARKIYPYLENLIRMGFVERQTPILGKPRRSIYLIKDNLFDFWFNFVFKYREEIEKDNFTIERINFSEYYGKKFEDFIRREIFRLYECSSAGRWWHRGEEIDIVALKEAEKEIAFFECKWSDLTQKEAKRIIKNLKRKAKLVKWHEGDRTERFGIIAKRVKSKVRLRRQGDLIYDLEDLKRVY